MRVQVLYFAALREMMNTSSETVDISPDETVAEVARRLLGSDRSIMFAVNDEFVDKHYRPKPGDTVAFIPPMAGG